MLGQQWAALLNLGSLLTRDGQNTKNKVAVEEKEEGSAYCHLVFLCEASLEATASTSEDPPVVDHGNITRKTNRKLPLSHS